MIFFIMYWATALLTLPLINEKPNLFWFWFHVATSAGCYALLKGFHIIH